MRKAARKRKGAYFLVGVVVLLLIAVGVYFFGFSSFMTGYAVQTFQEQLNNWSDGVNLTYLNTSEITRNIYVSYEGTTMYYSPDSGRGVNLNEPEVAVILVRNPAGGGYFTYMSDSFGHVQKCAGTSAILRLKDGRNLTVYSKISAPLNGNVVTEDVTTLGKGFCLPKPLFISAAPTTTYSVHKISALWISLEFYVDPVVENITDNLNISDKPRCMDTDGGIFTSNAGGLKWIISGLGVAGDSCVRDSEWGSRIIMNYTYYKVDGIEEYSCLKAYPDAVTDTRRFMQILSVDIPDNVLSGYGFYPLSDGYCLPTVVSVGTGKARSAAWVAHNDSFNPIRINSNYRVDLEQKAELLVLNNMSNIFVLGERKNSDLDLVVRKYNSGGGIDVGFGTGGEVVINLGVNETAKALMIDSKGRLVVAGREAKGIREGLVSPAGSTGSVFLMRLFSNGSIDRGFGKNGVSSLFGFIAAANVNGYFESDTINYYKNPSVYLAEDSSGKIIVGSQKFGVHYFRTSGSIYTDIGVARLGSNGVLDSTFGVGGIVTLDAHNGYSDQFSTPGTPIDEIKGVYPDVNNKIIVLGTYMHDRSLGVVRLNTNGAIDTTFGKMYDFYSFGCSNCPVAGTVWPSQSVRLSGFHLGDYGEMPDRIIYFNSSSSNGRYYLATTRLGRMYLMSLYPNGTLDPSFGTDGTGVTMSDFRLAYLGIQSLSLENNKLVSVATGNGSLAITRFNLNGTYDLCFGDPSCSKGGKVLWLSNKTLSTPGFYYNKDFVIYAANSQNSSLLYFNKSDIRSIPTEDLLPLCIESDWNYTVVPFVCPASGNQTKTWIKVGDCAGGIGHPASEIISCAYVPECTESDWAFALSPAICPPSEQQTRTWNKIGSCSGGINHSAEISGCTYQAPICSSFSYSSWSVCSSNGLRTRTVLSSLPAGCQGGNMILSEQCLYTPECTESNWQYSLNPAECPASEKQTRTWNRIGNCAGGIQKPATEQIDCIYTAPVCFQFTYSGWGACMASNTQTRTVLSAFPPACEGGNPLLTSSCTYVAPCSDGQIIPCDSVQNGVVSGHKDRCVGDLWTRNNTCQVSCNSGYQREFDRCAAGTARSSLTAEDLTVELIDGSIEVRDKITNQTMISLEGVTDLDVRFMEIVRSNGSENREFIIISNLSLPSGKTKSLFVERKNQSSNGVCIADRQVKNLSDLSSSCTYINCPGSSRNYSCTVSQSIFIINGLAHSGVAESYLYCGDNTCTAEESCSSCTADCGICQNTEMVIIESPTSYPDSGKSSDTSGGSSRGSSWGTGIVTPSTNQTISNGSLAGPHPIMDLSGGGDTSSAGNTNTNEENYLNKLWVWIVIGFVAIILIMAIVWTIARRFGGVIGKIEREILLGNGLLAQGNKEEAMFSYYRARKLYESLGSENEGIKRKIGELYEKLER